MSRMLRCGCDLDDDGVPPRRCSGLLYLLTERRNVSALATLEKDPARKSGLWLEHHQLNIEIAEHLSTLSAEDERAAA